jgi:hypothetical protein
MKKRKLIFPQSQWERLSSHMHVDAAQEHAAFAYASEDQSADRQRLLINEVESIPPEDLVAQTSGHVIPSANAIRTAVEKARQSSRVLVHVHNHLWHGANQFSATDIATVEQNFLWGAVNFKLLQAAVVTNKDEGAVDALVWSPAEDEVVPIDELQVAGHPFRIYIPTTAQKRLRILNDLAAHQAVKRPPSATLALIADRETRAFGLPLERTLSQLRVGIVGLSGTGSHLSTELAHLGVRTLCCVTPSALSWKIWAE